MTLLYPKPERFKCQKYLAFVRTQLCLACVYPADHAHHVVTRGAGGSDLTAVPLCAKHHSEIHNIGTDTFSERYNLNLTRERLNLLEKYIMRGK